MPSTMDCKEPHHHNYLMIMITEMMILIQMSNPTVRSSNTFLVMTTTMTTESVIEKTKKNNREMMFRDGEDFIDHQTERTLIVNPADSEMRLIGSKTLLKEFSHLMMIMQPIMMELLDLVAEIGREEGILNQVERLHKC